MQQAIQVGIHALFQAALPFHPLANYNIWQAFYTCYTMPTANHKFSPPMPVINIKDWYTSNIRLTHASSAFESAGIHRGHSEADVVRLHFGLKGNYNVTYKQLNQSFKLLGGHHNLFYTNGFDMEFVNTTPAIETFGIQFPRQAFLEFTEQANDGLKRFAEKVMKRENTIFTDDWGTIDVPIQQAIQQVLHSNYRNGLQEMFLLSKSIELLVLCTENYLKSKPSSAIKTNTDKEKIIAARDLINTHLQDPLNFSQVCTMVGLNGYKLKQGFKEMFSTTLFNYLTDQRLQLAVQLLLNTEKSAAEISYEMGYTTPQHFNNAFKKKFGRTPNSVRKNP